ncbi:Ig-like domain-containing protein, partial [Flavobacterium tistrianum]|uniref:Ig-like domain-containing protein n=1 Tax=Flavobacterium tistrianum TaxID=1685414 RepID=UPI0013A66FA5
ADGDALSIASINGTALTGGVQIIAVPNGTVNISASGAITFTPAANYNSTVPISFPYAVTDGTLTSTANIEITVTAVNDAPIANDGTNNAIASTAGASSINALTGSDIDGTIASYTILSLPADGILTLAGNPITVNQILTPAEAAMVFYTPSGTFSGNASFTFTVTDDLGLKARLPGTITIPVGNNAPVANDDTNTAIPSSAGATAIKALSATDTDGTIANYIILSLPSNGTLALNGSPVAVGQILTPAEAGMLTYDPSGSFSGNDSFAFTATDNSGAVDATPAVITIPVEKRMIAAVKDEAGPITGINEIVKVINVLDNDRLDSNPLTPADVDLKVLAPDPAQVLSLKADGTVEAAPNAPAGTYTLTYEICEKANSGNCASASVTVTVAAPTMTIKAESYCLNNAPYVSYSVKADNFTPSGLLTINWIDSSNRVVATQTGMPLNGNVLWPGAAVDGNNMPTDWPGWILANGQWVEGNDGFESTRPAVTMQFSLNPTQSLTVNYPSAASGCNARPHFGISAGNDDDFTTADGINGSVEAINVLANDKLNGHPVNPADVILTAEKFPQGITLNQDGTIDVAPGTNGGDYILTYQICEKANPDNCSSATVRIFVEKPSVSLVMKAKLNDENGNGNVEAGETVTYTFTVTNTGNTTLNNLLISDILPGITITGGPISLGAGQSDSLTFTGTYTLTQADINAGHLTNQATVSGRTQSGIVVTDQSDSENLNGDNPTVIELNGCSIKIYNAVSLNGDGMNERFYIKGIECYPDNTVQIYNRWGVLVFERDHYNNNDIVFKGYSEGRTTVKGSEGLPEGTYYYILKYKDNASKPNQESGYLYLAK